MAKKYKEYSGLDLPAVARDVQAFWEANSIFEKSISSRPDDKSFVFYEGPPSANGLPGIHHVMGRTIKDIFCRYKTLKGYKVNRKAGWDTHGLPVELGVEKELGITKEDIGKKISIEDYNKACREAVMKYTDIWNNLTQQMGYWVDMEDPYITYENKYIESVWWLLQQLYNKGLMYKGYTIQPYSPAAGTGLSSHELNQPGCYRDVKDTTVVAMFKVKGSKFNVEGDVHFLAWTTTPWTLPSNTALAVGPKIEYVLVETFNQYTHTRIKVILAKDLFFKHFKQGGDYSAKDMDTIAKQSGSTLVANWENADSSDFDASKHKPYTVWRQLATFKGADLVDIQYEQLLPYALPHENADKAFRVIPGDFVTTEDGTGIVHIAPTFGADDAKVAKEAGVPGMLVLNSDGNAVPLVDLQGKFVAQAGELAGKFVKNEYYPAGQEPEKSVDVEISIKLKTENKAFKVEKYEHSYPHCWRTDKPVLYYPLDSWFIRVTDVKERMVELNNTINWKPKSTGTGRFGNWLENANDWNLSRSRYWGIPIPVWTSEDGSEQICIGSVEQLKEECAKAVKAGVMKSSPLETFVPGNFSKDNYNILDLHKNFVDQITLVSETGKPLKRESDLIDVWFDSGAMPYAQWHYPFENKELIDNNKAYPADFIAEGVDQTRGWFYTLHAIATMCFDSVAFKNVVSNGLVLDKNGSKMSKRLGNAIDPFQTLDKYGPDATRWYMISNAQPWDNLKFDLDGITEVQRKFFGTLYNTYQFFALYANVDGFSYAEAEIPVSTRQEIDRWIISKLNSLIKEVDEYWADYEPTKAARAIQDFVGEHLSNWYVRLCRRRFWKGEYTDDKKAAYQTLYTCLEVVSQLSAPLAPFFMDRLFKDLNEVTGKNKAESVHLSDFPQANEGVIDKDLEERMELAQSFSSMVLSLRKKHKIKVRQPLQKILIPILDEKFLSQVEAVASLICSEVNVKDLEYIKGDSNILVKKIKANFKVLGPKYQKHMKQIAAEVSKFNQQDIATLEKYNAYKLDIGGEEIILTLEDVEILSEDIPGWAVANEGRLTVALDMTISSSLKEEGIARELVNRVQNLRKDKNFELTDRINLKIQKVEGIVEAIHNNKTYICSEVLANDIEWVTAIGTEGQEVEVDDDLKTTISITKLN
ncbi:MAG: isoleucine--tRNA ligase [Flavobacteriales bacterium]